MKIPRVLQKIFGSNPSGLNQFGKIGSMAAGNPEYTTDPTEMQSYENFEEGLYGIVLGNKSPAIQDINSLYHLFTRQLAYNFQMGIPEWSAEEAYYIGSVVTFEGEIYISLIDDNLNTDILDEGYWRSQGKHFKAQIVNGKTYPVASYEEGCYVASGKSLSMATGGLGEIVGAHLSPDNQFLAYVSSIDGSSLEIIDMSEESYVSGISSMTISAQPAGNVRVCRWSPCGRFLALGSKNDTPYVHFYQRVGNVLTKLANPASLPSAGFECTDIAWSPNGDYIVFAGTANVAGNFAHVYIRQGATFVKVAGPTVAMPSDAGTVWGADFTHDGKHLVLTGSMDNKILVFSITFPSFTGNPTFTLLAVPDIIPANAIMKVYCHPSKNFFAFGTPIDGTYFYKIEAGVTSLITHIPIGSGAGFTDPQSFGCWHPTGDFFILPKRNTTTKQVQFYRFNGVGAYLAGEEGPATDNDGTGIVNFSNDFKVMFSFDRYEQVFVTYKNSIPVDFVNKSPRIVCQKGSYKSW